MKKRIFVIAVIMLCLVLGLAACKKDTHKFSTDWSFDAENHWHECSQCDEVSDKAAHTWDEGKVTFEVIHPPSGNHPNGFPYRLRQALPELRQTVPSSIL